MIRIDELNENKVLTVTASGKLTREDYHTMVPELENLLKEHDKLRFYIKLEDCNGFKAGALWEDIKFDFKHKDQFGKTAVIGDKRWEEWGTRFSGMFFPDEVKFFHKDKSSEAWEWVNH